MFTVRNVGGGAPFAQALSVSYRDLEPKKRPLLRVDMPLRDVAKPFEGSVAFAALEPLENVESIILESDDKKDWRLPEDNLQEIIADIREARSQAQTQ